MRKARLLSPFAVGGLAVTLTCLLGIPGKQANEGMAATLSPTLHNFGEADDGANPGYYSLLTGSGTALYGMTTQGGVYPGPLGNGAGTIFKFDTKNNVKTVFYNFGSGTNDGVWPQGSLILSGTTLYGTTPCEQYVL